MPAVSAPVCVVATVDVPVTVLVMAPVTLLPASLSRELAEVTTTTVNEVLPPTPVDDWSSVVTEASVTVSVKLPVKLLPDWTSVFASWEVSDSV